MVALFSLSSYTKWVTTTTNCVHVRRGWRAWVFMTTTTPNFDAIMIVTQMHACDMYIYLLLYLRISCVCPGFILRGRGGLLPRPPRNFVGTYYLAVYIQRLGWFELPPPPKFQTLYLLALPPPSPPPRLAAVH